MAQYIDKDALVSEIKKLKDNAYNGVSYHQLRQSMGLKNELSTWEHLENSFAIVLKIINTLEVKEDNVWKIVDNINPPQVDKNKIYCVITKHEFVAKNKYLTATVVNHPQNEDLLHWNLLQWKCTEFPFRCYDMCEGDKYMQIV